MQPPDAGRGPGQGPSPDRAATKQSITHNGTRLVNLESRSARDTCTSYQGQRR